ncbi:hypothetical protein DP117_12385 [Brasilonema sp. UFV-L1]|nr:hypothetical protein [Brasilonema sp. UFV-L1]
MSTVGWGLNPHPIILLNQELLSSDFFFKFFNSYQLSVISLKKYSVLLNPEFRIEESINSFILTGAPEAGGSAPDS